MANSLDSPVSGQAGAPVSRNALLPAAANPQRNQPPGVSGPGAALIANAIGHAAMLSDTPEKWEATLEMLKRNGVDPSGYEDFDKGRALAMAAVGGAAPEHKQEAGY
jgi:hypothetical protein